MENGRSRSKRNFYYDQDYDSETLARTKPRYHHHQNNNHSHYYTNSNHYRRRPAKLLDPSSTAITSFRILCRDEKVGGVIGKSGSIIKTIRQHTGAWINVLELAPGDNERVIEISDSRRREPDERMPSFSPSQEALCLIHERILECESEFESRFSGGDEDDSYGSRGGANRVFSRLVVSRMHVGCLLGKGGKIIEQMRIETSTQIRVLPRDHNLPRCVSTSEEIVQVSGEMSGVKTAIEIISSRLRESQHRDRSIQFQGRIHSPDHFFPPDGDFDHHMNNKSSHKSSMEGSTYDSRSGASLKNNHNNDKNHAIIRSSSQAVEYDDELVFKLLCPAGKIERVVGETDGIMELLRNQIGVDIQVIDPMSGSDEHLITVYSDEGPEDELFPSQEALLHIQTRIADIVPDGQNTVTTRLLVPYNEVGCLEGRAGSLSEMSKLTGADIQILPRQEVPPCISDTNELIQIVGEIKTARNALIEVTSRLRARLYREFFQRDSGLEASSPPSETYNCTDASSTVYTTNTQTLRDSGGSNNGFAKLKDVERREDVPGALNRFSIPLVTRSTLEIVIPEQAVSKLVTKSRNRLSQFSELSGANVTLVEDRPQVTEKCIQISGTPEQVEKAQSLFQGFILSIQEDAA